MKTKRASGLIFAVVLLFVILGMVVTLASVTMLETKMNQKTKSSVGAFYNSESGVEWALNKISTGSGTLVSVLGAQWKAGGYAACPDAFGGENTCKIYFLDDQGKVIASGSNDISLVKAVRSVGSQGGDTQRAIEAAVANTGGGCYVDYSLGKGLAVGSSCGAVGGFTIKRSAGLWGSCDSIGCQPSQDYRAYFRPPGGNCLSGWISCGDAEAYVCCQ
ncbi:MAG: hypothetical protein NT170_02020 [Candidatus Moranbacteria bacterium]|nr:hypothetical protein [Candidatus Moranbacteria bacterium]